MSSQKNTILTKLSYFEWPVEGPFAGYIQAQALPHIGAWSHYSPANISKNHYINQHQMSQVTLLQLQNGIFLLFKMKKVSN